MRALRWLLIPVLVGGGVATAADWKNLQVLPKTISKDDLRANMKMQSKALGMECDGCHDVPDMASDKNQNKIIARKMMQMEKEINEKWIKSMIKDADKHQVTCGTCHQGHESPPAFGPTPSKS
jgi:hypothetical protein